MIFQLKRNPWGPLTITHATILHILWPTPKVVVVASIPQTWSYELTFCKYVSSLTFLANKLKIIMEGGKVHLTSKVAMEFCMQQDSFTYCFPFTYYGMLSPTLHVLGVDECHGITSMPHSSNCPPNYF